MDDLTRELQTPGHRTRPDARSTPKRGGLKRILGLGIGAILILGHDRRRYVYWLRRETLRNHRRRFRRCLHHAGGASGGRPGDEAAVRRQ